MRRLLVYWFLVKVGLTKSLQRPCYCKILSGFVQHRYVKVKTQLV